MKRNEGFTLVELLITLVVGGLVTAAAFTLLLTGIRIYGRSANVANQQITTNLVMEVVADLVAEEAKELAAGEGGWTVKGEGEPGLIVYQNNNVYVRGTTLLEGVVASTATLSGNVMTISLTMENEEPYTISVYCRKIPADAEPTESEPDEASSLQSAYLGRNYQEVLNFAVEQGDNPPSVTEFLSVLASQYGSRGQILNEAGESTGTYFSEWYIGGYEDNPDWSSDTPWCACYLSWALERCGGLFETPRYANVDNFWIDLVTEQKWSADRPEVGDLVFFDWIVDEEYNPQHVGAVIAVSDGWIYTIEGNSSNRVAVCRYETDDPTILGYGKLQWK